MARPTHQFSALPGTQAPTALGHTPARGTTLHGLTGVTGASTPAGWLMGRLSHQHYQAQGSQHAASCARFFQTEVCPLPGRTTGRFRTYLFHDGCSPADGIGFTLHPHSPGEVLAMKKSKPVMVRVAGACATLKELITGPRPTTRASSRRPQLQPHPVWFVLVEDG
jgi:hypothetical protein